MSQQIDNDKPGTTGTTGGGADVHTEVKAYYRAAANRGAPNTEYDGRWGASLYDGDTLADGAEAAASLSMGCGNPFAVAQLSPGDIVLDLGSGGGLDVIVSARRVAPGGMAYGVDFLPEMVALGRANAAEAGVDNIEFLEGAIEDLPLPDASVDVVISNCVINLAPDKRPVLTEVARVLRPGGRLAVSDVVVEEGYTAPTGGTEWVECGAGGFSSTAYIELLTEVGLVDPSVELTHQTGPGRHAAIVRATRA